MLSYFALITLVEISGLIIPYIWFMIVASRRGRTWGTIAVIILFLISYVNTYFSLPDLAYPSLIDGWLMWLIGGLIVVAILKRFVYGNGQTPAKTDQAGDGIIGQAINRFTGTFGWLGKLAVGIVLAVIVFIILGSVTQLVTKMNPQPAV